MKINYVFLSILAAVFLTCCSTVISKHPVGLEKYAADPNQWDGTWLTNVEPVRIKVIDETKGIIQFSWIDNNDTEPKIESITIQVMRGDRWLYANVLELEEQKKEQRYYWGKIFKEDNQIIFWLPSTDAFKTAVELKKLQAIVEKATTLGGESSETILLQDDPKTIVNLVEEKGSHFFDWEHPVVLIKLRSSQ